MHRQGHSHRRRRGLKGSGTLHSRLAGPSDNDNRIHDKRSTYDPHRGSSTHHQCIHSASTSTTHHVPRISLHRTTPHHTAQLCSALLCSALDACMHARSALLWMHACMHALLCIACMHARTLCSALHACMHARTYARSRACSHACTYVTHDTAAQRGAPRRAAPHRTVLCSTVHGNAF